MGSSSFTFPKFSILDPVHTFSVPKDQTVYGIVDMMSHVFEQYFHDASNTLVQDQMCEGVLRTVIEAGPKLLNDLENYELRETIMFAGTIALNNFFQWDQEAIGLLMILNMRFQLCMTFLMVVGWQSYSHIG